MLWMTLFDVEQHQMLVAKFRPANAADKLLSPAVIVRHVSFKIGVGCHGFAAEMTDFLSTRKILGAVLLPEVRYERFLVGELLGAFVTLEPP